MYERTVNPALQRLADKLYEAAMACAEHKGKCSICPERRRAGFHYDCNIGLGALEEARRVRKDSRVISEGFLAELDVHARNYIGEGAGDVYEAAYRSIPKSRKVSR